MKRFKSRLRGKAKATPWFNPYMAGKPALDAKPQPGIYLIRSRSGRIVYVGYSTYNVKKTLYRHFQSWKEQNHAHATYPKDAGYQVRVITGMAAKDVHAYEQALIKRIRPRDNALRYTGQQFDNLMQLSTADFDLILDPDDNLPF